MGEAGPQYVGAVYGRIPWTEISRLAEFSMAKYNLPAKLFHADITNKNASKSMEPFGHNATTKCISCSLVNLTSLGKTEDDYQAHTTLQRIGLPNSTTQNLKYF